MRNEQQISRKGFINTSLLGLVGLSFLPGSLSASNLNSNKTKKMKVNSENYTLKNVRLEVGFNYKDGKIIGTQTDLFTVKISKGKITSITQGESTEKDAIDAQGLLMLPSFRDMHIHLDKTIYGEKWEAVNDRRGVKEMIAFEQKAMPELLKNSTYKAEKLIELLQSKGTSFARSHVNIEPTSKLKSLENLQLALENKNDSFGAELVIFPQHGLFYTDSLPYMKEAAQMDIDFIGGLDPVTVDGNLEKTIDTTVQLALDYGKGIDIHLHETGKSGIETIQYLIQKVNENPSLKGKTFFSHCFALAKMDNSSLNSLAEQLADAQIGIISTVPFGQITMPIPDLLKRGVNVMVGNDSIVDHWETMGTGSVLQKANLAAQLYNQVSEYELSRWLKLATAGPIPLNDQGEQQWPKVGDQADFVLVDASCSAEAVARVSPIRSLVYKGNIVY